MSDIEKKLQAKRLEHQLDRREKTAVFHTQIREMTKVYPEAAELFEQSWNEKDTMRRIQFEKRALEALPPEISRALEIMLTPMWEIIERSQKAIENAQTVN